MEENININDEYRKIFGETIRPSLYAADDEEYNALRQQIIDTPRLYKYPKGKLPFCGIRNFSYNVYYRRKVVKKAEEKGFHIFYITKFAGRRLTTYMAGYYDKETDCFYILPSSFFPMTDYYNDLLNQMRNIFSVLYRVKTECKGGYVMVNKNISNLNASLAASFALGRKATFREWKDAAGRTLDAYYAKYKLENIDEKEEIIY